MLESTDVEIPGSTLPGTQDKVQAELIGGRYIACRPSDQLRIPAFPAPPLDLKKVAQLGSEPGPPSIVDTIIEQRRKAYEIGCTYSQLAIEPSRAIVELSGKHARRRAD